MPYRPSLRSIWTLIILAILLYSLYAWCENSHVKRQMPYFREKMEAANLMDRALRTFVGASTDKSVNADSEAFRDSRLDAVIGQQYSLITKIGRASCRERVY
jgi:hypothetical protein